MTESPADRGAFEFDPDVVELADELAEAFILEELDPALLDDLNKEYLELLASQSPEELHMDIETPVLAAAVQVAGMVVGRLDAAETRNMGRPSRIPYSQ